jgi:hypothetical protein
MGRAHRVPPELRNVLRKSDPIESRSDPRAEPDRRLAFMAHGVAKDLSNLFLSASAMAAGTALELCLDVVVELSDQDLSHKMMMISRYRYCFPAYLAGHLRKRRRTLSPLSGADANRDLHNLSMEPSAANGGMSRMPHMHRLPRSRCRARRGRLCGDDRVSVCGGSARSVVSVEGASG